MRVLDKAKPFERLAHGLISQQRSTSSWDLEVLGDDILELRAIGKTCSKSIDLSCIALAHALVTAVVVLAVVPRMRMQYYAVRQLVAQAHHSLAQRIKSIDRAAE